MSASKSAPALSDATSSTNNSSSGSKANLICQDLEYMKEFSAKIKKYMENVDMQINRACEKLNELQTRESSEMELDELKMVVKKLKTQIPSLPKLHSGHSNPHQHPWPNVNKASDEMMHNLYKEQKFDPNIDAEGLLEAFRVLPPERRMYLMCFVWFPPTAIVKKRVMIYLWMVHPYGIQNIAEDDANQIFDEFIAQGFIQPVTQNSRLVPDSCMMSQSLRSSLTRELCGRYSCNLINFSNEFSAAGFHNAEFYQCLVNVNAAIIDGWPENFEKIRDLKILYLGRWHTSSSHHIELPDTRIFNGLKIVNQLTFLSLRGISLITELPSFISKCTSLKILDLRACHNLEVIPNWIGSLKKLTHLDVSECYLLEYMPKSLAELSNLKVLKGFLESASRYNKEACILSDLSNLLNLQKLNIIAYMDSFAEDIIMGISIPGLEKLTISWRGEYEIEYDEEFPIRRKLTERLFKFFRPAEYDERKRERELILGRIRTHAQAIRAAQLFRSSTPKLQKLDLQGFPGTSLPLDWVSSSSLKTLYIRGGKLRSLPSMGIQILHLKYLRELRMDWGELMVQFPKLKYLHIVECPLLTNFPCDENGVWTKQKDH